jgi:signal transduction histidine kinase
VSQVRTESPPAARGGSLSWRLGWLLGGVVLVVLLVAGIVVNRVVSGGFESVLATQQQERLDTAADALVDALSRPTPLLRARAQLVRLATNLGGQVTVRGTNGNVLATAGRLPSGETSVLQAPITSGGTQLGTLEAVVPHGAAADQGFLRLFNLTLAGAGLISVVGIVLLASYGTERLMRPLRTVVDAAHRLGNGDLAARAEGGPDRESGELAEAFNQMADRLQRSEMLRRRAASDVAHDLATPATVLESQLQAMVDGVVPANHEQLEAARAAAGALGSVIGQMGELASAEAAPLHRRVERVDVGVLVGVASRALDGLFRERSVTLRVGHVPEETATVGDPDQLSRALRNVVSNAAQHSVPGGVVTLDVGATSAVVQIRCTDQGPGIAAEDVPHVFERFYRADRSRSTEAAAGRQTGSGIGLTIARDLLAANRASIRVERTGSDGTTFLIELPRAT